MRRPGFNVDLRTSDSRPWRNGGAAAHLSKKAVERGYHSLERDRHGEPAVGSAVSYNCSESNPGWYCDAKLTELLRRFSEAFDPATQKDLAGQIQAHFTPTSTTFWPASFPLEAYRSNLLRLVPFGFPVFWNIERRE